jgi:segregation and condensation protein B
VREEHDDLIAEFVGGQAPSRLSQAALETLAVIAYKQPVTRSQVAAIRAVNVDSVVRTLVARGSSPSCSPTPRPARSTTARPTRCS